jgi:hypothetical protein
MASADTRCRRVGGRILALGPVKLNRKTLPALSPKLARADEVIE